MADESYIRGLTETIQGQIEEARQKTLRDNRDAEIMKSEAPKQWMELKAWLGEAIAQVNSGLTSTALPCQENTPNEIEIHCVREVTVNFYSVVGQISTKGATSRLAFDAKVEGNKLYFIEDFAPHSRVSIERMGKQILDAAVKS